MYEVSQAPASEAFMNAWITAGKHLQRLGGDGIRWLRVSLIPPLAEHLSFLLGNQLFFVYLEANGAPGPSNKQLFLDVAAEARAIPAILPMEPFGAGFQPKFCGWGLRDPKTNTPLDPPSLVSSEKIEMSDWEVHDFAIQIVTDEIAKDGGKVMSTQPSPHIDPSIWFQDDKGPAFVVVRSGRYPLADVPRPTHLAEIAASSRKLSQRGFFASVTLANSEQQTASRSEGAIPLYRGHGAIVRYLGLELI